MDGFSLGRVLDDNTTNDPFNFPNGDTGTQSQQDHTGSATIANSDFAGLIADGFLNLSFDFSGQVNCCGDVQLLKGSITFDEGTTPVPLPASSLLLLAGVGGLAVVRRRKTAA